MARQTVDPFAVILSTTEDLKRDIRQILADTNENTTKIALLEDRVRLLSWLLRGIGVGIGGLVLKVLYPHMSAIVALIFK